MNKTKEFNTYSFDVFDTILTRTTATPKGIFSIMENTLKTNEKYSNLPPYLKDNFYILRIHAESFARNLYQNRTNQDITIEQIYQIIALHNNLDEDEKNLIKNLELQTEMNNIVGIDENISLIKELISKGKNVILITDTYLPKTFVNELLISVDDIFSSTKLFVSCEFKKTKATEDLYKYIRETENLDFANWIHTGDNRHSDYLCAQRLGITPHPYKYTKLENYEQMLINKNEKDVSAQLIVGTAKNSRLLKNKNYVYEFGASLGGAMLFPYVQWIIQQAQKMGLKQLLFIARDGYILKEMTDILIKNNNYNIQTKYIYGSRYAWRLPQNAEDFEILNWHFSRGECKDMSALLNIIKLNAEETLQFLPKKYHNLNKKLSQKEFSNITKTLSENENFKKIFQNRINELSKDIENYLKQEIDFSKDDFAFVDVRGIGKTQECMAKIVQKFYSKPIKTFFMSMGGYYESDTNINYAMFPCVHDYNHNILEIFTRAPHGQTMGYEKKDKIVPVFEQLEGNAIIKNGFYQYLDGVKNFAEIYSRALHQNDLDEMISLNAYLFYFKYLLNNPDKKAANIIGATPFLSSITLREIEEYAPKLSLLKLKKQMGKSWFVGSIARSSKIRKFFNYDLSFKHFLKSIFECRISPKKDIAFIKIFGHNIDLIKAIDLYKTQKT